MSYTAVLKLPEEFDVFRDDRSIIATLVALSHASPLRSWLQQSSENSMIITHHGHSTGNVRTHDPVYIAGAIGYLQRAWPVRRCIVSVASNLLNRS